MQTFFFPETRFARDGGGRGGERSKASQHALRKKEVVSQASALPPPLSPPLSPVLWDYSAGFSYVS